MFKEMPQRHDLVHFGNVFGACRMQDQGMTVTRYLVTAVVFLLDLAHFSKEGQNVAPFQVVRDGVLKDSVKSALMRRGKRSCGFHNRGN